MARMAIKKNVTPKEQNPQNEEQVKPEMKSEAKPEMKNVPEAVQETVQESVQEPQKRRPGRPPANKAVKKDVVCEYPEITVSLVGKSPLDFVLYEVSGKLNDIGVDQTDIKTYQIDALEDGTVATVVNATRRYFTVET